MTLTSTNKAVLFVLIFSILAGFGSAEFYYNDNPGGFNYEFSSFESNQQLLGELIAPFLLVTILFQRGIYKALVFTLDEKHALRSKKKEKKKIKKHSVIISLLIAGMMVPTPYFQMINEYTLLIFGGIFYLLGVLVVGIFLYLVYRFFKG